MWTTTLSHNQSPCRWATTAAGSISNAAIRKSAAIAANNEARGAQGQHCDRSAASAACSGISVSCPFMRRKVQPVPLAARLPSDRIQLPRDSRLDLGRRNAVRQLHVPTHHFAINRYRNLALTWRQFGTIVQDEKSGPSCPMWTMCPLTVRCIRTSAEKPIVHLQGGVSSRGCTGPRPTLQRRFFFRACRCALRFLRRALVDVCCTSPAREPKIGAVGAARLASDALYTAWKSLQPSSVVMSKPACWPVMKKD